MTFAILFGAVALSSGTLGLLISRSIRERQVALLGICLGVASMLSACLFGGG